MRLRKLTLNGFKSFADPTEFAFDEPVIGVVGPNGCGKSNIVDAIKWVLGERSSKSLRGKEMIDVIFAGSAGRKPSGMASVTLSFDNPVIDADADVVELQYGDNVPEVSPDSGAPSPESPESQDAGIPQAESAPVSKRRRRALPIEADVVEVERRLYRDGTSKYIINSKTARLRDIRDLFLDTGVGADAYSIIEQGKVDAMLLASPQERRTIFEEAAGIAKYKQRRIESQRKLERAVANLTLTREQLASTERRLKIVKGQAAKARRFKELDSELRAARLTLAFDQYDDIRQRLDGLTSRLAELEGGRSEAAERQATIESAKQDAELLRHELQQEHKSLEEQRTAALHAEQSASQRKAMTERSLSDARAQADSDGSRLAEIQQRVVALGAAAEEQTQLIAAASEQLADAERQIEAAAAQRAAILEQRAETQGALAERRAAAANIDRERAGLLASLEADARREEGLREQSRKVEERRTSLAADVARLESMRQGARQTLDSRKSGIGSLEKELGERDALAASLTRDRRELAERVSGLEQGYFKLDSRRTTLQEMVESRVGLGDAAREVLKAKEEGRGFGGVIAPLADLIETGREHAAAVEAALGQTLQALVVESVSSMPTPAEMGTLSGRVMFVPVSGLSERGPGATPAHRWREEPIEPGLTDSERFIPLRSVVRVSGLSAAPSGADEVPLPENGLSTGHRAASLIDRLLGSTYLVDSLDAALMMAALSPGARFVTRDGSVMEPDGRVLAGPPSSRSESGILQRRSELAELETETARARESLEKERAGLRGVDTEAAAISALQSELRSRIAGEQRALVGEQARVEQLASELSRLERDARNLEEESRQLSGRIAKHAEDRQKLRDRSDRLAGLHQEQCSLVSQFERQLAEIAVRADESGDRITAMRVEAGRLSEQLGSARREHRRLEAEADSAGRDARDLGRLVEQSRGRLAEHEQTIAAAVEQIGRSAAEGARLRTLVADAAHRLGEAGAAVSQLGEQLNSARAISQQVERDWHALEVSRRELEVKRENLEERTQQELEIDISWEYPEYRQLMASGDVRRVDPSQCAAEAEALREEIRKLGSVNLEALEEEGQLEQRNEELIRQVADIDDAAHKLTELIETLNTASKERFGEIFARIQEHFAGSGGMFRKLFGGGKAEIRLMPLVKEIETPEGTRRVETDEVDLLESGIEVIARPPGKEPRSISQLSGGEKTLTAVALLLAIFQSKPSCFCILDEVDAALDESNVGRYCAVVREFTTHSHFIVITHNKKTMQTADRLYGVTMQERGVSTRVTVRFEQVQKDGSITGPAATTSASEGAAIDTAAPKRRRSQDKVAATDPLPAAESAGNGHTESPPQRDLLRRALAGMREDSPAAINEN